VDLVDTDGLSTDIDCVLYTCLGTFSLSKKSTEQIIPEEGDLVKIEVVKSNIKRFVFNGKEFTIKSFLQDNFVKEFSLEKLSYYIENGKFTQKLVKKVQNMELAA